MVKQRDYKVFLSYSYKDRPWVEAFTKTLEKAGVREWFDAANLPPGERWDELTQDALRKSQILVLILSPNSIDSPWTFFELGAAFADGKRIIPVLTEDLDWRRIPFPLARYQALKEHSPEEAGNRVAEVLEHEPRASA
jgi:hypothetical protein